MSTPSRVVAKVWSDYREGKIKPRGYVSKFELQLLMRTSPRFGGNAVALLIEVRRCNPRGSEFTLSPEAVSRLLPEIGRRAFEHARDVLIEAGVVEKVRNFRRDHRGFHDAALYVLTPVREMGEIPAMKVKTSQERARKPRAATEKSRYQTLTKKKRRLRPSQRLLLQFRPRRRCAPCGRTTDDLDHAGARQVRSHSRATPAPTYPLKSSTRIKKLVQP